MLGAVCGDGAVRGGDLCVRENQQHDEQCAEETGVVHEWVLEVVRHGREVFGRHDNPAVDIQAIQNYLNIINTFG